MQKKVVDKFKVLLKSRKKGKVGTGTITMNLRFDVPYEKLGDLTTYLEKYKK
jgi:hypothetical protein